MRRAAIGRAPHPQVLGFPESVQVLVLTIPAIVDIDIHIGRIAPCGDIGWSRETRSGKGLEQALFLKGPSYHLVQGPAWMALEIGGRKIGVPQGGNKDLRIGGRAREHSDSLDDQIRHITGCPRLVARVRRIPSYGLVQPEEGGGKHLLAAVLGVVPATKPAPPV